jgi:hypothetical protein
MLNPSTLSHLSPSLASEVIRTTQMIEAYEDFTQALKRWVRSNDPGDLNDYQIAMAKFKLLSNGSPVSAEQATGNDR